MLPKKDRELLERLLSSILRQSPEGGIEGSKVLNYLPPKELMKKLSLTFDPSGIPEEQLLNEIRDVVKYSVDACHPLFLNQLSGGPNIESVLAEILCAILNPTMATYEVAPALTLIEKSLIKQLNNMIGYHSDEGIMVTGGSNGNLVGLLCARNSAAPTIKSKGFESSKFRVYVSEEAHYSFSKAANIAGIGSDNLCLVPADQEGAMQVDSLEELISRDIKAGIVPLLIGATAGTTVLGAFDPLEKIAHVAKKYKIWYHVDAAWGGGCLFSKKLRSLLNGIECADSVSIDSHKSLSTGLVTSFFLSKHKNVLLETNKTGNASYLFHDSEDAKFDTGTYSLQCGRRADALKLWLLWRSRGSDGLGEMIDHQYDLASYARQQVQRDERFVYIHSHYLNVCFQIKPFVEGISADELTIKVRSQLVKSGRALVNYSTSREGKLFFRLVFPNSRTQPTHLDQLFYILKEMATELESTLSGKRAA